MLDEFKNKYGDKNSAQNIKEDKTLQTINFLEKSEKNGKNPKKAKSSKKIEGRPKEINYKILKEKNPLLSNKKKLKFSYKKCSVKTGRINFITKRPTAPKYTITVLPVFIMITTDKLILTKDEKRSNFIRSIPLVEVQRIDQHYVKTFCFDIILNEIVGRKLTAGQLSLCANNEADMNMWVNEILDFKKCSLKGMNEVDHNGKIVLDLEKINSFTRNNKNLALSKLFYNGKDKAIKPIKNLKTSQIKSTLTKILSESQKGEIASHQLKRQYSGRLMKARSFEHNIEGRAFNMKRMLANRMFREKEQEASQYSRRTAKKEVRILRNVQKEMSSMKMTELTEYTKLYQNQIKMQAQHAQNKAKMLMHMVSEQDKLSDYRICFSDSLRHFKNKVKVTKICKLYYGKYVKQNNFRVKMSAKRELAFALCAVIFTSE